MSPRSHLRSIHKRVPEPQLLDLGLPLSLPSPVAEVLHPLVQVGPESSSASSSSNQPPKQNPPQSSSPPPSEPSSNPRPSSNPTPSQSPSSSTGGSPNNGGSGGSSNDGGNGGTTTSDNNGGNGNQGSQGNSQAGGNSNDQGNNNDGNANDSSANGNGASTQSGTTSSSGNSNSTPQNGNSQSQSSSNGPATTASSPVSGTGNGGTTTSNQDDDDSNTSGGNSDQPHLSTVPILGEISAPNQSGSTTPQSGNSNNSPSKTSQSQSSTGSGSEGSTNDPLVGINGSNGNNGTPSLSGGTLPGSTSSASLPGSTLGATSKSNATGSIAAGVTVSLAALSLIAFIVFVLRRRHQRKKYEHRVTWISGLQGQEPDMVERSSIRSSWGTPIERPSSWRRISNPFAYATSGRLPPVLPLPVHSLLAIERPGGTLSPELPENPFSDDVEAAIQETPQPLLSMTTLPIRFSLISAGSNGHDPFDDIHRTAEPMINNNPSHMKLATEQRSITGHGPSQANFPLPPSTPASVKTCYAVGSISDLHLSSEFLPAPSVSISFPDSPISPTFASTSTAFYPRRASVKYDFRASQARSDEIHLDKGDEVNVVSVYEDGWAFVQKEKDNERGLAPLHCLDVSD